MHTIFKVTDKNARFGIGIKQQNKQTPITVYGVIFAVSGDILSLIRESINYINIFISKITLNV